MDPDIEQAFLATASKNPHYRAEMWRESGKPITAEEAEAFRIDNEVPAGTPCVRMDNGGIAFEWDDMPTPTQMHMKGLA